VDLGDRPFFRRNKGDKLIAWAINVSTIMAWNVKRLLAPEEMGTEMVHAGSWKGNESSSRPRL
jgi:hypothetical protein